MRKNKKKKQWRRRKRRRRKRRRRRKEESKIAPKYTSNTGAIISDYHSLSG